MSTPAATTQAPETQPNANGSGNAGSTPPATPERTFTQTELDSHIADRLKRERDAASTKAAKDKEAAEAEEAKKRGEWESVAKGHEARVKELEALQTQQDSQVEAYEKALAKHLKAAVADWPQQAKDALPKDVDALELAEHIERVRPLVALATPQGRTPGAPSNPKPSGETRDERAERERQALRARGFGPRM